MFPTIYGILSQLGLSFLLRDDFTTPETAPIASPRTAEPGPGTLTIVDTGGNLDISSGALVWSGLVGAGDPLVSSVDTFTRGVGLAAFFGGIVWAGERTYLGVDGNINQVPSGTLATSWYLRNTSIFCIEGGQSISVDGVTKANTSGLSVITRTTGGFWVHHDTIGNCKLSWVGAASTASPLYVSVGQSVFNAVSLGSLRVVNLPAPWDTDNGIATDVHAGNVTAGTTFVHEADCLIEWTQTTVPSAGTQELWFRSSSVGVDGWRVTVDITGALSLDEVVSSVPTNRGTAAGVIANGDRIVIVADDETIRVYEANVLRITYASAVTNKTATAGELETLATGGAIADLISWPRVLSGAAKSALDEMAA